MAAPVAPDAPRFSPVERPRAAIATDGTLAAIVESTRVVVLELPGGEPFAEVGVDPAAAANEVAWVGAPPRLLVLSRYAEHTRVHLVDPHGPRALADIRIESPMRLAATCGAHALIVGAQTATVVTAADNHLAATPYPSRTLPANAGAAGANFLVAHADSVEEWDPQARMPKRRLKLARPATITALGGSDRVVWMTTQQEPARLDVLALVDRGQPKAHDLPEPIAYASGHPRSDLVVCVGESGKVYVVDLDGRSKLKTLAVEGIDKVEAAALVVGRVVGVLAAQTDRPIVIVTLDGQTVEPDVAAPSVSSTATSGATASAATATGSATTSSASTASTASTSSASASSATTGSTGSTSTPAEPAERKKPPPPPPGRSPNPTTPPPTGRSPNPTTPPPISRAANPSTPPDTTRSTMSMPIAVRAPGSTSSPPPSTTSTLASTTLSPSPSSSSPSLMTSPRTITPPRTEAPPPRPTPPPAPSASPDSDAAAFSLPTPSPSSSSLARPATRAFARAPTPHPRANSEGVEVDLSGVFEDLENDGNPEASPRSATFSNATPTNGAPEQFDSPLAFEAKPVPEMMDAPATTVEPDPRLAKLLDGNPPELAKPAQAKVDTAKADSAKADAGDAAKVDTKNAAKPAIAKPAPPPADDDDEDLAPPYEPPTLVREEDPPTLVRDGKPAREGSGPVSGPVREFSPAVRESAPAIRGSAPAIRDVMREPPRKPTPRREVTIRQAPPLPVAKPAWRDEVVFWTYEVFDGVVQRGAPIASPMDDLAVRFAVPETILPALVVLYGAHLAGERGVAPVHIARVLGSWDEALGRGLLAQRGLATFTDSRVRMNGPIQRMLDEVPVETGALVGVPGHITLPGPHVVIAKAETPLKVVAVRWLGQVNGAILAAHDDADLGELFVEARARGAAPMFRIAADELLELGTDPALLVVTDEDIAESLGVPRLE